MNGKRKKKNRKGTIQIRLGQIDLRQANEQGNDNDSGGDDDNNGDEVNKNQD